MYNKQTWLDEIPDMTKPIYDASGKQKTDPQTGRPLFELVQVGTRITSNRLNTMEGGIEAAHTLVEQLAKELGGNFVALNNGTMGLQCSTQGLKVSWTSGIAYVGGRRYQVAAGEMSLNPTQGQYLYVDTDGVVKKTTSQATAQKGLVFFYVATDTSGVISTTDHRVNISLEEILKKLKDIDIEEAVTGGASGLMTGADAKFVRVDGETKTGAQEKADAVKDYVDSRLDTSEYSEVTLQPGLQVIQGKRNAPFALSGLKGRTLVNLLGRLGGGEQLPSIDSSNAATLSVDTSTKDTGLSSYKVTANNDVANAEHYIDLTAVSVKVGSFYVAVGMVKPAANATTSILVYGTNAGEELDFVIPSDTMSVASVFSPAVVLFKATTAVKARVRLRVQNTAGEVIYTPNGEYANFDSIRLYEVNETEYAALANMPLNQIAAKYPYVDSVQPVRNPYAIRYGENLLPPFYEWGLINNKGQIISPYSYSQTEYNDGAWTNVSISVKPFTDYTLSLESIGGAKIRIVDNKTPTSLILDLTTTGGTFNSGDNSIVNVYVSGGLPGIITNPMLTIGTTAKPFKPREDVMLALQTDLYADPLTGTNADEVFEKDGCYFKLKKWQRTALDGALGYRTVQNKTDYKIIGCKFPEAAAAFNRLFVSKYNGNLLTKTATMVGPDNAYFLTSDLLDFNLSIANADSGWGDSYTPTADEIKAYFMGWRMFDSTVGGSELYNRTDGARKAWIRITDWSGRVDGVVPTTLAGIDSLGNAYTPYQLVYQLATPTVESITSEGQLTLIEGNNQVEVGTGIVLRESSKVVMSKVGTTEYYHFNNIYSGINNPFKYRVEKILNIYANGKRANGVVLKNEDAAYGKQDAHIEGKDFIKDASYTATYFMLDPSPAAPFVGSVAENEKALLSDMNDILRHNATAVSIMESAINEAVRKQNKRNVWGGL
ncbi:hypothetical protein [Paenibacillus xylanilyticus]|uniref:Uncharacterized protein n=1 Tax=Paenibacillus xylanilyticus TaxID=248903 RepID=A0A7Y6EU58_9BACL|nr:hypothetical protein [Paenibacillus xylanilyticus]NUU74035.1 hypothetical protein [Paenibacillus xylanilyticus]